MKNHIPKLAACLALSIATHLHAADLQWAVICTAAQGFYQPDGQYHWVARWYAPNNQTIYVVSVQVLLYPCANALGDYLVGSMAGQVVTDESGPPSWSGSNILLYWTRSFNEYTYASAQISPEKDFGPNWIRVDPGHDISTVLTSIGFVGRTIAPDVAVYIWYTLTP